MGRDDKEYEAFQIFEQIQGQEEKPAQSSLRPKEAPQIPQQEAPYYEIEYDSCPMPGVGKFVLKTGERHSLAESSKIEAPRQQEQDPVRELFNQMRDIARESRYLTFSNSKFYDKKVQQENSRIFYHQGVFMQDFEDDCDRILPYSAYFPNYQMMGYGQLRTYFTWRTKVRKGNIQQTSVSYAFLYLYELLNNIGVDGPQDGLERLMVFWDAYRVYDQSIDKYVLKWLKDYHIFYELPQSFREFIDQNGLSGHYPNLADPEDQFGLYCAISKYDIRKSAFYTEERQELVRECFRFTVDRLREVFAENHMNLEESVFQPTKHMSVWTPFSGALFHPAAKQRERRVVLSQKEIYLCDGRQWTFSTTITTESGRQLLGYVLKQMETVLRRLTQYKYKLSANLNMLSPVMADELRKRGISLETAVTEAVTNAYREATRTVVRVDQKVLERIRQEALATQEKLIVPEQEPDVRGAGKEIAEDIGKVTMCTSSFSDSGVAGQQAAEGAVAIGQVAEARAAAMRQVAAAKVAVMGQSTATRTVTEEQESANGYMAEEREMDAASVKEKPGIAADSLLQNKEMENRAVETTRNDSTPEQPSIQTRDIIVENDSQPPSSPSNPWEILKEALTQAERKALALAFDGETSLKRFADEQGIMLEVLVDGINEKAMDTVGDSLLDDAFEIYEDYIEEVKGMVESI